MATEIINFMLDTLFPIACLSCGKSGEWICSECLPKIPLKITQICPLCEKSITPDGRICFKCQKHSALDGLLIATSYKNDTILRAIHNYKYRFVEDLYFPLGKILIRIFLNSQLPIPDLIIPVPLHPRRLRFRGFNQSELLANYLGENLTPGFSIPVESHLIIRSRYTSPQMKIKNYHERKKNLEGVFKLSKNEHKQKYLTLKNKRVLLIDDVATTGTTLFECAKVLKNLEAKEILSLVIARQEIK
jgi:ComF family protein